VSLHKVEVDLDMLCAMMLNGVGGEVGGSSSVERGAPDVAAVASRPLPRHWPQPGTQPRHSSGR
jgi:hypothetical protein